MEPNLILFFVGVPVILVVFWWMVFWTTKNTTNAFGWTTFVLCLAVFSFLLPRGSWLVAYLATMGTFLHAVVAFWLAHEVSPWLRVRLHRERDIIPAIPMESVTMSGYDDQWD